MAIQKCLRLGAPGPWNTSSHLCRAVGENGSVLSPVSSSGPARPIARLATRTEDMMEGCGSGRTGRRSTTMRTMKLFCVSLLATGTLFLPFQTPAQQDKPAAPPPAAKPQVHPEMPPMHQHANHGGFMREGMHHAIAKGVTLDAKVDAAAHVITLREGPMNL